jgi:hypothetical protein
VSHWTRTIKGVPAILDMGRDLEQEDREPDEIRDAMVGLLTVNGVPNHIIRGFERAEFVSDFNEAMNVLYDWADLTRVWIDPTRERAS